MPTKVENLGIFEILRLRKQKTLEFLEILRLRKQKTLEFLKSYAYKSRNPWSFRNPTPTKVEIPGVFVILRVGNLAPFLFSVIIYLLLLPSIAL